MSKCKDCLSEQVCRYNDGINLYCKEDCECPHFKNKADFVEVVRCGQCKHYKMHYHYFDADKPTGFGHCTLIGMDVDIGDKYFCSCGERK